MDKESQSNASQLSENSAATGWDARVLALQFPFHFACKTGDVGSLEKLMEQFPSHDHDQRKHHLWTEDAFYYSTPAHWAAFFGKLECLRRVFLNRPNQPGFTCDIRNSRFQQTCLHLSAFGGHADCLRWLLDSGADPHCKDYLGETAAHKAARSSSIQCLSLLSAAGVRLSERNHAGMKCSELADSCGNSVCASYLRRAEALQEEGLFPPFIPGTEQRNDGNKDACYDSLPHLADLDKGLAGTAEESFSLSVSAPKETLKLFGAYGFQPLITADQTRANATAPDISGHFRLKSSLLLLGRKRGMGECGTSYGKRMRTTGYDSPLSAEDQMMDYSSDSCA